MSKLRDRIREISRRRVSTFGFAVPRDAARQQSREVLVVAEVADEAAAAGAIAAGADVLIATGAASSLAGILGAADRAPVGFRAEAATAADATAAFDAGAHFLVFDDTQAAAAALLNPKLGYVVTLAAGREDAELRLLRALDLDAALIAAPADELTVRDQLRLRRTNELVRKALIARIDHVPSATTLEVWRDAGVAAVLVADASMVAAAAAAANDVPRPRETNERVDAVIPSVSANMDDDDDD